MNYLLRLFTSERMTWAKIAAKPREEKKLSPDLISLFDLARRTPKQITSTVFESICQEAHARGLTKTLWGQNYINEIKAQLRCRTPPFVFCNFRKEVLKDFYAVGVSKPFTEKKRVTFGGITAYEVEKFPVDEEFNEKRKKASGKARQSPAPVGEIEAAGENVFVYGGTIKFDGGKERTMFVPMKWK